MAPRTRYLLIALIAAATVGPAIGCSTGRQAPQPLTRYVIEREIAGAGSLSPDELRAIANKSNQVLRSLGPDIQWVESYVTRDKIYCVYLAKDPEIIRRHARAGGFPADRIEPVATIIDPETGR